MLGPRGRKLWVRQYAPVTASETCTFPATPLPDSIIVLAGYSNAFVTGNLEASGGGANWARIAGQPYMFDGVHSSGINQVEAGLYLGYVGTAPSTSVSVAGLTAASGRMTCAAEVVGLGPTLAASSFHLTHGATVSGAVQSGALVLPELADIGNGVVVYAFADVGNGSPGVPKSDNTVPQQLSGVLSGGTDITVRFGLRIHRSGERHRIGFTGSINNAVACATIIRPA